jgi:4-diphosphocytidyl-2-C-methyl-D-erythritol kinase
VILFPNCKINIGLNILRRRADGYHDIETLFYPVPLKDIIEIIPSDNFGFYQSGLAVPGEDKNNLCVKAYQLIKKKFPELPAVKMYLHKKIPPGSGLGGGSADGAFMLLLLNHFFHLQLSIDQLLEYALQLGSDCPFFILNKPCLAVNRGESLKSFPLDLSSYSFVLVHPGIHIDTTGAFSKITPALPAKSIAEILQEPITAWPSELVNDFEKPVFTEYPFLLDIKTKLYDSGALYAGMTGSGSSFYGIFKKNAIPSFSFDQNFRVDILK